MLTKSFASHPIRTTVAVVVAQITITALVLAFLLSLSSCEIQRDCPGAGRQNGYSGYADGHVKAVKGSTRKSY